MKNRIEELPPIPIDLLPHPREAQLKGTFLIIIRNMDQFRDLVLLKAQERETRAQWTLVD